MTKELSVIVVVEIFVVGIGTGQNFCSRLLSFRLISRLNIVKQLTDYSRFQSPICAMMMIIMVVVVDEVIELMVMKMMAMVMMAMVMMDDDNCDDGGCEVCM